VGEPGERASIAAALWFGPRLRQAGDFTNCLPGVFGCCSAYLAQAATELVGVLLAPQPASAWSATGTTTARGRLTSHPLQAVLRAMPSTDQQ
jgi:hypothetical protein